jgi:hypothetical protein
MGHYFYRDNYTKAPKSPFELADPIVFSANFDLLGIQAAMRRKENTRISIVTDSSLSLTRECIKFGTTPLKAIRPANIIRQRNSFLFHVVPRLQKFPTSPEHQMLSHILVEILRQASAHL